MEKKVIFLGLALILFGMSARGLELSGACSSSSVQCDLQINSIDVFNDFDRLQTFFPRVSGEVAQWIKVLPENITLLPGERGVFEVYTIATCYADPGFYTAQVSISNGQTENFFCDIEIKQGHFVDVDITPDQKTVSQCEPASYTIELENNTIVPKQEEELVTLSVSGVPREWVDLETTKLIVKKGEREKVNLTLSPPCDTSLGEYEFEVKASLFNPDFFSTDFGMLSVSDGQDLRIRSTTSGYSGFDEPFLACNEKELSYSLEFENNGKQDDKIELEIPQKPSWVKLSESNFILLRGEKKVVTLTLEKTDETPGPYNLELIAKSEKFGIEKKIIFDVDLKDCYNLIVENTFGKESVCNEDSPEYRFLLRNDKDTDLDLKASIEGLPAELSSGDFTVKAGEEKELSVKLNVSGEGKTGSIIQKDVFVELIIDTSGSMDLSIQNEKKIEIAKKAARSFVESISQINLGLRVFGQSENCSDSVLLVPLSRLDAANVTSKINGLNASGDTPLAGAIASAGKEFKTGKENYVIIVSDGKESCNGNIDESVKELLSKGIKVYAIGFDIDESGKEQLQKIAQKTSGEYFDASNADELIKVFKVITKKLEIEAAQETEKTFSLKIESQNYFFEKDFSIGISDCHNIAVTVPDTSVCRQVKSASSLSISNLGSKEQTLFISTNPFWAQTFSDITVAPGEERVLQITFEPKKDSSDTSFIVHLDSDNVDASGTGKISYLDDQTCYGFGMTVEKSFEGRIGEGERRKVSFSNNGQTGMLVLVKADQPWVYFEPEQIEIQKGETGFTNFYITPPFDFLGQTKKVTVTATNEFGFSQEQELTLEVTGPGFGLIPANIEVTTKNSATTTDKGENNVTVEFELKNQAEQPIEILSIETQSINAEFELQKSKLLSGESTKVIMHTAISPAPTSGIVRTDIRINTSEGVFERKLQFNVVEEPVVSGEEENHESTGLTGLFSFANIQLGIVVFLAALVLGLLLYSLLSKTEQEPPKQVILKTVRKKQSLPVKIKKSVKTKNKKTEKQEK